MNPADHGAWHRRRRPGLAGRRPARGRAARQPDGIEEHVPVRRAVGENSPFLDVVHVPGQRRVGHRAGRHRPSGRVPGRGGGGDDRPVGADRDHRGHRLAPRDRAGERRKKKIFFFF